MEQDYLLSRIHLPPLPATIHFVGIGGIGMSGLARIVAARGYQVTGSDASDSPSLAALRDDGFAVIIGHSAAGLGDPALVVTTAAAPETNPELTTARERAIPIVKRATLLGLLCNDQVCVAVAGTHGKSTTSGMFAFALDQAGINPSFAVGARVNQLGANAGAGRSEVFVAEADEYDYSFLWLRPAVGIITNIEFDHPDIFTSLSAVEDAFLQFAERIRTGGTLVVSADDPGCRRLIARLQSPIIKTTFGIHPDADWRIVESDGGFGIRTPGGPVIPLHLQVPGRHNLLNAAAAIAAGAALGISPPQLRPGLEAFTGVGRRFDVRGEVNGVTIIDDYAHHPTEIRSTIAAARERYPGARLWALFQPHTYSRTKRLLDDFAAALGGADRVVLTAIYPAREIDDLGISSSDIAGRITGVPVEIVDGLEPAARFVSATASAGDVVLVLGAGDIWKVSEAMLAPRGQEEDA